MCTVADSLRVNSTKTRIKTDSLNIINTLCNISLRVNSTKTRIKTANIEGLKFHLSTLRVNSTKTRIKTH